MKERSISPTEQFFRTAQFDASGVDEAARTVPLSFSSEAPVERYFGTEILDHNSTSVDLSRLNAAAPLLLDHDQTKQIGVVRSAEIGQDKKGRAVVQFYRSAAGQEAFQDVIDGIRQSVSVGYQIGKAVLDTGGAQDTYRAIDWQPFEISLVSIPADTTVGVGRSQPNPEVQKMAENTAPAVPENTAPAPATIDVRSIEDAAIKRERSRIAQLNQLGQQFRQFGGENIARELVATEGAGEAEFSKRMLDMLGKTSNGTATKGDAPVVDLSKKEQRDYSLLRALNAHISGDWSKAGLEREVSDSIQQKLGRAAQHGGFMVPMNLRTAYGATTTGSGKEAVSTDLLGMDMIELLRANTLVIALGARLMSGLVSNVAIPRMTAGATAAWLANEGAALTESEGNLDQVTLSPKTLAAYSVVSRQALVQSSIDMEALIRQDLALAAAQAIDLGAIKGTGTSGQPTGLLNTAGIGSVAMGTNGAAISMDGVVDLRKTIAKANALRGSLAYLTNPDVVAAIQKLKSTTGEPLWEDDTGGEGVTGVPGMLKGYKVGETTNVPNDGTKGTGTNLSTMIFGNFNDLIIGEWGAMEIVANPYGAGFRNGQVDIRVMHMVDVAVRHPASFAAITDIVA